MRINYKNVLNIVFFITFSFSAIGQISQLCNKYVLVIDMQKIGTKQMLESDYAQNLLDKVNLVISKADSDKVLYVEAIMAKLEISLTKLTVQFEPGLALDDRLALVGNTRIIKTKANTFTSQQLQKYIKETGASEFIIVGLMAEHCIKETALGGINGGFSISVIPDAIAAESDQSKKETMQELQKAGVNILSLEEL
ncbi:MAG TPA: isochorismatase family protein [Draconibacterium sp.]|nr:isochorismatase family protein [Draconibacterium sp.]